MLKAASPLMCQTEQLLNLSENTKVVCGSWSRTGSDLPICSSGCCRALWCRYLHSHPSGVFCSHHDLPSLLVPNLLWSANQNEGRRSLLVQNILLFLFPFIHLSLTFCAFFTAQNFIMRWNYEDRRNKVNTWLSNITVKIKSTWASVLSHITLIVKEHCISLALKRQHVLVKT